MKFNKILAAEKLKLSENRVNSALNTFKKSNFPTQLCIDIYALTQSEADGFMQEAEKHEMNKMQCNGNAKTCDFHENKH